jgi:Thermopsin
VYKLSPKEVEDQIDIYELSIGASSGGGCLDPDAAAGECFPIQSNVVTHNQYVDNTKGSYWAQNVPEIAYDSSCSSPCVSGTYSVTFLDNIWNFSSPSGFCPTGHNSGAGCVNPSHISGNDAGKCTSHGGAPLLYYCVGATTYDLLPPFTVETRTGLDDFNFAGFHPSTGVSGKSCINFYGTVIQRGFSVYNSYYDGVTFHSGSHAAGTPTFFVSNSSTPVGLLYDNEWVMGGPGGGSSNSVFIEGGLTGETSTCTVANCCNYPSMQHAWSSGADTAEAISDVYMLPYFNSRDLGYITFGTDNPGSAEW